LARLSALDREGYIFDDSTRVLRIRHDGARDIDVQGNDIVGKVENGPPIYLTFDDPHLAAGTELDGPYPSGVMGWPGHEWKIGTPEGKFGTFNLVPFGPQEQLGELAFHSPRIFAGVDVYNGAASQTTIAIRSEGLPEISFTLKPDELRRVRTGWQQASSRVTLEWKNGSGLRFDNLAYYPEP
jgi:hypothetical protein